MPTPPFPSYVSGHSAFTAAWARAMELATGKPDFNFKKTVRRLYVEQRELAQPVTLSYPTFAAAAEASGISRIWAGVHWPADNERGQELGRKVGESVWRRAQQFMLGTASPPTAVFAALRPPFWFHDNETSDHPAHFEAASGLAVDLPPGGAGVWRSIVVDAMPAGAYELKLKAKVTGDQPIRLKVAIEPSESSHADPLAVTEAIIPATGSDGVVTIPWTSDGVQPFQGVDRSAGRGWRWPATRLNHSSYTRVADGGGVAPLLRAEFCGSARPIANRSGDDAAANSGGKVLGGSESPTRRSSPVRKKIIERECGLFTYRRSKLTVGPKALEQ